MQIRVGVILIVLLFSSCIARNDKTWTGEWNFPYEGYASNIWIKRVSNDKFRFQFSLLYGEFVGDPELELIGSLKGEAIISGNDAHFETLQDGKLCKISFKSENDKILVETTQECSEISNIYADGEYSRWVGDEID